MQYQGVRTTADSSAEERLIVDAGIKEKRRRLLKKRIKRAVKRKR